MFLVLRASQSFLASTSYRSPSYTQERLRSLTSHTALSVLVHSFGLRLLISSNTPSALCDLHRSCLLILFLTPPSTQRTELLKLRIVQTAHSRQHTNWTIDRKCDKDMQLQHQNSTATMYEPSLNQVRRLDPPPLLLLLLFVLVPAPLNAGVCVAVELVVLDLVLPVGVLSPNQLAQPARL